MTSPLKIGGDHASAFIRKHAAAIGPHFARRIDAWAALPGRGAFASAAAWAASALVTEFADEVLGALAGAVDDLGEATP